MKATKTLILIGSMAALVNSASALDITITASAFENGLGTSNGTDFGLNYLIRLGHFGVLTDAEIFDNRFNFAFLNSNFVEFMDIQSGTYLGSPDPNLPTSQFGENHTAAPTNFAGKNIYFWAFNRTDLPVGTFGPGDEMGIFKSPTVFPSGADEFNQNAGAAIDFVELGGVGSPNIVVGGFGVGTVDSAGSTPGGAPLYNTAAVPEPSAALAIISGIAVLCGVRRRRNA
jgi:hypothetical protein